MSRTTDMYLDSIERINFVIGLAIADNAVSMERAEELINMTDEEKRAWYENLSKSNGEEYEKPY